jgi:S1-C subfamily serine protease
MYAQNAAGVYKRAVNSTVTIVTDNRQIGSGFFVEDNIVATNFHVMEGASAAYCYLNNYTVRYEITGYLAVDTEADLVLPEVSGVKKPAISQWIETSSLTLT